MITYEEHERAHAERHLELPQAYPSGVSCPKCGKELFVSPKLLLLSNPPRRQAYCAHSDCKWMGSLA